MRLRSRSSFHGLRAAFTLLACGCSATGPTPERAHPPAFGSSENPALQQIEVRKVSDLPALAIVERAGDPTSAVVATVRTSPEAAVGLSSVVATRLEAKGLHVQQRVQRRAFSIVLRGDPAPFFAAFKEALAVPIRPADTTRIERPTRDARPEEKDVDECEGRVDTAATTTDATTLDAARAAIDVGAIAFGFVGTKDALEPATAAWSAAAPFPHADAPASAPWPTARSVRVSAREDAGPPSVRVALFVSDPLRAVTSASALEGEGGDPLRSKLARTGALQVASVRGVSRAEGGCIAVSLSATGATESVTDDAIVSSVALVEESLRKATSTPAPADAALERVARARDPIDAAELAAWWTFAKPEGGDAVAAIAATLPRNRAPEKLRAVLDRPAPAAVIEVDGVLREEVGQGELWVLVGNPCAAAEEGPHQWGATALAARARALGVTGEDDVSVESFATTDGIGILAHAAIRAGESDDALAERVATAAAGALFGGPPLRDALGRAELGTIADLERVWGPRSFGLEAFARAFGPDHLSLVEPRGTVADVVRADYARAAGAWATLAAGPARVVTLANRSASQAAAVERSIGAWILPSQSRGCAKIDVAAFDRTPRELDVDLGGRALARLGARVEPSIAIVLARLIETRRPHVTTESTGGILVLGIDADAAGLGAEVDALVATLDAIAKGDVTDAELERARIEARDDALRDASDPRTRLLALFARRSTPSSFSPIEPASASDFRAWAKMHAAADQWVVVRER